MEKRIKKYKVNLEPGQISWILFRAYFKFNFKYDWSTANVFLLGLKIILWLSQNRKHEIRREKFYLWRVFQNIHDDNNLSLHHNQNSHPARPVFRA